MNAFPSLLSSTSIKSNIKELVNIVINDYLDKGQTSMYL